MFLYQTPLSDFAHVWVTHNMGVAQEAYAGNLALHVQDDSAQVLQRRAALERNIGLPVQWLNQVHGTAVLVANHHSGIAPTVDAAVTRLKTLALAVMTADCLPVVLAAKDADGLQRVAVAHAGWRGLLGSVHGGVGGGVIQNTLAALTHGLREPQIFAHLAPCIGVAAFEVGTEVRELFVAQSASYAKHFTATQQVGKFLCNLEGVAREVLHHANVTSATGGGWCTVSDPRLASYRRRAVTGRFATVVALV